MSSVELKTGLAGMADDPSAGCRLTLNAPEIPLADGWRSRTLRPRIDGEMPLDVMTPEVLKVCGGFSVGAVAGGGAVGGVEGGAGGDGSIPYRRAGRYLHRSVSGARCQGRVLHPTRSG